MEKKLEIYKIKHKILMDKVDNNLILIKEIAGEIRLICLDLSRHSATKNGLIKIKQILKMG